MNSKQELRRLIRASHPLTKLSKHPRLADARTVLLYSALPDEVPTLPLLNRLTAEGKTVLLPRVVSDTDMELRRYTGPNDLEPGAFGIMEPTGELFTDYDLIDVAIVPGMAFDREGHRLGRGKGYYDRFLARLPHIYKIGICFPFQLVDKVPADVHDILMDEVIC
jgi:5-formyltetrahydrofolate cyclo-ligase